MTRSHTWFLLLLGLFTISCSQHYYIKDTKTSQIRIKPDSLGVDSGIWNLITPYKQKLDAQMNEVIAITESDLKREQPEGNLNNLMAEAILWYVTKNSEIKAEVSALNYGGIRIPFISKGNITVGKVYELMPFDNMIEVLELKGKDITALCDLMALNGGWPVSGIRFHIENRKATNITINGNPVVESSSYLLVTSDFMANGGDKADMLKNAVKRTSVNYKVRDAIMDYLKNKQSINLQKDGRISFTQP